MFFTDLLPTSLQGVAKAVAAVVIAGLGWGAAVVASPEAAITAEEWIMGGTALATGLGVYAVANKG